MKYEVYVETHFSSAHRLQLYKGKCENLHGHNWKVGIVVSTYVLDKNGMVVDFVKLKKLLNRIIAKLDHKYLNQIDYFKSKQPTAENIAAYIHSNIKKALKYKKIFKIKVIIWETPTQYASYEEE